MRHRAVLFGILAAVIGLLFLDGSFQSANILTQTAVAQDEGAGEPAPAAAPAGGSAAA